MMIYLIQAPLGFKFKQEAKYNYDLSIDTPIFRKGRYIAKSELNKPIIFNIKLTTQDTVKFDQIINNSSCLLVNQKIIDILNKLIPEEVQFFDTEIRCKDGVLTNYKLVNITQKIEGANLEKSIYTKMATIDEISGFKRLILKKECMNGHKLAILAEFPPHILASEELKQAFESARVTGLRFVLPQDYYAEIYPYYAENSVWPRAME